ncbi:RNA-binding cell elongation regulator Jag/EloR [Lachnospira sp.]|jgi:spoIIIJ-associated protein|uniref:RNA-binding cell elongation regulator Jag/EloR n=1 Tax=Lachnospira sp. TaxID=2049031 RepID=UPI00257AA1C2|nr:RNA-binding cell elongation regulator Jag/EloR [Lachnospira sp.]
MDFVEVTGKSLEEAITNACLELGTTSDDIEYDVVEKGSNGFLGIGSKDAKIKAWKKGHKPVILEETAPVKEETVVSEAPKAEEVVEAKTEATAEVKTETKATLSNEEIERRISTFLNNMFKAMNMDVDVKITFDEVEESVNVELLGEGMGVLIGKRGQTLDSIQYLTSLVVNKGKEKYVRIKIDTENYRNRRKETLESLAKNIAYKVKRSRRAVSLEPMNPYERRIIHSTLQNDKFVSTKSEGEEPFRHVVVFLDKEKPANANSYNRYNNRRDNNNRYNNRY